MKVAGRLVLGVIAAAASIAFWAWRVAGLAGHPVDYADSYTPVAHLFVGGLSVTLAGFVLLAKPRWAALVAVLHGAALAGCPGALENQRLRLRSSGCANHSNHVSTMLALRIQEEAKNDPGLRFPATTELDEVLTWTGAMSEPPGQRTGFYCPGRMDSTTVTGYVFVGGDLPTRAGGEPVLICFCAAECHPHADDDRHALMTGIGAECCDRSQMADRIARALQAAEAGRVAYSKGAVTLLKSELEKIIRSR